MGKENVVNSSAKKRKQSSVTGDGSPPALKKKGVTKSSAKAASLPVLVEQKGTPPVDSIAAFRASDLLPVLHTPARIMRLPAVDIDAGRVDATFPDIRATYTLFRDEERRAAELPRTEMTACAADIRAFLADVMLSAADELRYHPQTVCLAMNLLDRSIDAAATGELPGTYAALLTLASATLLLACKYEEGSIDVDAVIRAVEHHSGGPAAAAAAASGPAGPPPRVCDHAEVVRTETRVCRALGWRLTVPTVYHFLTRYLVASKACGGAHRPVVALSFCLLDRLLLERDVQTLPPSLVAAAIVWLARAARCKGLLDAVAADSVPHYTMRTATLHSAEGADGAAAGGFHAGSGQAGEAAGAAAAAGPRRRPRSAAAGAATSTTTTAASWHHPWSSTLASVSGYSEGELAGCVQRVHAVLAHEAREAGTLLLPLLHSTLVQLVRRPVPRRRLPPPALTLPTARPFPLVATSAARAAVDKAARVAARAAAGGASSRLRAGAGSGSSSSSSSGGGRRGGAAASPPSPEWPHAARVTTTSSTQMKHGPGLYAVLVGAHPDPRTGVARP